MDEPLSVRKDLLRSLKQTIEEDEEKLRLLGEMGIDACRDLLRLKSGRLLIADPTYLADVYNADGVRERFVKDRGIFAGDFPFGGSARIFRMSCGGLRIARDALAVPEDAKGSEIDARRLSSESASLVFMDYTEEVGNLFEEELTDNDYLVVELRAGTYRIGFECEDGSKKSIVVEPIGEPTWRY